ncbi:MAG: GNAT family N-acetyltransferase [Archaeoglobaceae archaeon]|nr:GNAT family N-acetyltransferase [Archaeoglobaceae archaeon]
MRVRGLKDDDLTDAIRILTLCFERELKTIFKDVEIAREILKEFFKFNRDGVLVAEEERVLAIAWLLSDNRLRILKFLRNEMGFIDGLRAYLLLKFFLRKPKKGEGFLVFIAVSPLRRGLGIGSAMMREIIANAKSKNLRCVKCVVRADSDALVFFRNFGFEIIGVFKNRLAEKYFLSKEWILLSKDLSALV